MKHVYPWIFAIGALLLMIHLFQKLVTGVGSADAEDAIALLCLLDWPTDTARASVEHVCGALTKAGTRQSAYEALRRDRHARALLDLPRQCGSNFFRCHRSVAMHRR